MIYLAIDTCVWLELLRTDFHQENNHFNELIFWIEHNYLKIITSENLNSEWNRNKVSKRGQIVTDFTASERQLANVLSDKNIFDGYYHPDKVNEHLNMRISKIDNVLNSLSEIVYHTDSVMVEASNRVLARRPPSHIKDSYSDTINILALKDHIAANGYEKCYFTSINSKDYSAANSKYDLHDGLKADFTAWRMEYVYFDNSKANFSGRLFRNVLRPNLPSFEDHLKEIKKKEEHRKVMDKKIEHAKSREITDPNYLEYIMKIDDIIAPGHKRTALDDCILNFLFDNNEIYKQYFLRKLAENGMV